MGERNLLKVSQQEKEKAEELAEPVEAAVTSRESVFSSAQLPETLFKDMLSSYRVKGVIDLSPGQGEFAQACLSSRVAYLAVCCTEAHCAGLEHRLTQYVMDKMAIQGHPMYRPQAAAFFSGAGDGDKAKSEDESSEKEMEKKRPKKEKKETDRKEKEKGKEAAQTKLKGKEKGESKVKKEKETGREKERRGRTSEGSEEDTKAKKKRGSGSKTAAKAKKGKRAGSSEASSSSASTMPW